MSTITIQQMMASSPLRQDRMFSSLFSAYRTVSRPGCGKCRKKKSLTTCITLLRTLISIRRDLITEVFNVPAAAKLSVFNMGTAFGIRVE